MFRIRQIELNTILFNQYDNGISELIYHQSSDDAVNDFFYLLNMIIRETPASGTIYILSDLTRTGHLPLASHYSKIKALNANYDPQERPLARFANIYEDLSQKRLMVLSYMQSLELPGVKLNMYSADQRNEAIAWLLYGG